MKHVILVSEERMAILESSDVQSFMFELMRCSCAVPGWGILIAVLLGLCLLVLLLAAQWNCKRAMADYRRASTLADTDELTGLWSRHAINRALHEKQCLCSAHSLERSVIFIDVNGLKAINDSCGHLVGDCVLKMFAQSLSRSIRFSDYAGRWGGDKFVVLVSGMRSEADIAAFCNKLQQETSKTMTVCDRQINISASFGYALANVDGTTVAELIRVADARMYKNKRQL